MDRAVGFTEGTCVWPGAGEGEGSGGGRDRRKMGDEIDSHNPKCLGPNVQTTGPKGLGTGEVLVEKGISPWLVPTPSYNIAHKRRGDFVPYVAMVLEEVSFSSLDDGTHA